MIRLFPSSNPSPENALLEYIKTLQEAGVEFLHCDVMDGIFVKNKCLSTSLLKQIAEQTTIGMDIHLMITEPLSNIQQYAELPATYITTHFEAYNNVQGMIKVSKFLRSKNKLAGLAINPNTPVDKILDFLPLYDLILVMGVEPGESGQPFITSTLDKVAKLKEEITRRKLNIKVEVDGGVNQNNMQNIVNAGADILVMGNAMYICADRTELVKKVRMLYPEAVITDTKIPLM